MTITPRFYLVAGLVALCGLCGVELVILYQAKTEAAQLERHRESLSAAARHSDQRLDRFSQEARSGPAPERSNRPFRFPVWEVISRNRSSKADVVNYERAGLSERWGPFYRHWHLSETQIAQFETLTAKYDIDRKFFEYQAAAAGFDAADPKLNTGIEAEKREYESAIKSIVGEGFDDFLAASNNQAEIDLANHFNEQLYLTETALTGPQLEKLSLLMSDNRFAGAPATAWHWVVANAQSLLRPDQLAALKILADQQTLAIQLRPTLELPPFSLPINPPPKPLQLGDKQMEKSLPVDWEPLNRAQTSTLYNGLSLAEKLKISGDLGNQQSRAILDAIPQAAIAGSASNPAKSLTPLPNNQTPPSPPRP